MAVLGARVRAGRRKRLSAKTDARTVPRMGNVTLSPEEADVLRCVLGAITVKGRTGEIGIVHGMDRFVSSQLVLRKAQREALDSLAKRAGLSAGVRTVAT